MPSSRDRNDPWFRLGSIDVTTTVIISAMCVVSFFLYALSPAALDFLVLYPSDVTSGQFWRLLTWPIANAPSLSAVIATAIFWYLGTQIENQLGRAKYLWLILLVTLIPSLLATGLDVSVSGIRSLEIAIFVVFVCETPKVPFFFGIPAWILAVVIVGIDVLQLLGARQSEVLIVYMASIITAVWTARSFGMLNDFQWLPRIRLPWRTGSAKKRRPAARANASGQVVVDGPWPTTPVYRPMQDQAEVDKILDKIAIVGMDGLTSDEKKRLNDASKRLRKGGN